MCIRDSHGNDPGTAQHTDGGGLIVIAGPDGEIGRAEVPGFLDLAEIPASLLDTCDVGVLGQLRIGLRPVSYTHLDVYKRQVPGAAEAEAAANTGAF